jgi:hypothetical protein
VSDKTEVLPSENDIAAIAKLLDLLVELDFKNKAKENG